MITEMLYTIIKNIFEPKIGRKIRKFILGRKNYMLIKEGNEIRGRVPKKNHSQ